MDTSLSTAIHGLSVLPLLEIGDGRGAVLHVLRCDEPAFLGFGECYCSETLPGAVKAWKRHKAQTQNLAVPVGRLRLVVFDDRPGSPTRGALEVIELGRPDNYARVTISPGLWYGFSALGTSPALIVNCADFPHDSLESERLPESDPSIPYRWQLEIEQ
jgi:dTDP-4-dehydrorhamnose 3,5-epimerase